MRGFIGLFNVAATFVFLGALVLAGYGAISVSPEYGDGSMETASRVMKPVYFVGTALVTMLITSQLKKRF